MTHSDAVGRVVHLPQEVHVDWDAPVEHAHAAVDRAGSGAGAPGRTGVPELAHRRQAQEPSGVR